jgi:outer membrane protein insertion porin family
MLKPQSILAGIVLLTAFAQRGPAQDSLPLGSIRIEGNTRLSASAITAASGLRQGQRASTADFDKAAKALFDTGLFASAEYSYARSSDGRNFLVTFKIQESPALLSVIIDVPGIPADTIWAELATAAPLLTKSIPVNAQAEAYYRNAIEAALLRLNHPQKIATRAEGALGAGKMTSVFLPANLPKVTSVRMEGIHSFESAPLVRMLSGLAVGRAFTEHDFRGLLDANVKPMYEEKGFLTVTFNISFSEDSRQGGVAVSTVVEEGPIWRLGQVNLSSDLADAEKAKKAAKFPEGKVANWKRIQESLTQLQLSLKQKGQSSPRLQVSRMYHEDSKTVDLLIEARAKP